MVTEKSSVFPSNCQVVFLFSMNTPLKRKHHLRESVIKHGATISYIITKKTNLVFAESADLCADNYKVKQALKFGIPIVGFNFLEQCIQKGRYLDPSQYVIVTPGSRNEKFDKGQIEAKNTKLSYKKKYALRPEALKAYTKDDDSCPSFECPLLVKAAMLQKKHKEGYIYEVLELHTTRKDGYKFKYRICTQTAKQKDSEWNISEVKCRFTEDANSALNVFSTLYSTYISSGYIKVTVAPAGVLRDLGSELFHQWFQQNMCSSSVEQQVAEVVETFWLEAVGSVEEQIATPLSHLKLSEVEKAESDLIFLKDAIKEGRSESCKNTYRDRYYTHLPHTAQYKGQLDTIKDLVREQHLCQVVKDVIAVRESTDWSPKVSSLSKYNALHCYIQKVSENDPEFIKINKLIHNSSNALRVCNIFQVYRQSEHSQFIDMHNKQLLFHGSKVPNYVGILSRGLLLPQVVAEDFGAELTDLEKLGYGLYFSDSIETSLKYTSKSQIRGCRYLLICEVALGDVFDTKTVMLGLKSPPNGFNSVHGVKRSTGMETDFQDDEYVIYDVCQQRIRYLIELTVPGDELMDVPVTLSEEETPVVGTEMEEADIDISDIKDVSIAPTKIGLCAEGNAKIPLKSVHIRAKLIDLASEVVILQEYINENNSAIEAKYVFPLDDNAAVCGFEAFINKKHIIGKVKVKETAREEYKEAISQGHGAYLMEEEKADLFTVRVGNLPPHASVVIKITYVAELQVHGDIIDFYLPGSVANWTKHIALSEVIQTDVDAVNITKDAISTTVQIAIEMPFVIKTITSPTHKIKMKRTDTKAVVELPKNAALRESGFRLEIGLSQIHLPRMWVERHPDKDSQACMLTFYPEFDAEEIPDPDIVFMIDCSNSMKGDPIKHAQKLLLLALDMLPKHCQFNILAFGTTYTELHEKPVTANDKTIKEAYNFVKSLSASQGNTNVWSPVKMYSFLPPANQPRNLYIISDGHISDVDGLLRVVRSNSMTNRIFTLCVGSLSDVHVMKNLAKVGGGSCQYYDPCRKHKWQAMLKDQLDKASQPNLTAVRVEWQQLDDNCKPPVQAPATLMSLYSGQREVIYGFVPNCTMAVLKAEVNEREVSTMVSTSELSITTGKILHTLTARAIICDWQNGLLAEDRIKHEMIKDSNKDNIIELSMEYSIVTPLTSFVAVEERSKDETFTLKSVMPKLVSNHDVDILPYLSWQVTVQEEKPIDEQVVDVLDKAAIIETYSIVEASRIYEEVEKLLPQLVKLDKDVTDIVERLPDKLHTSYLLTKRKETKAKCETIRPPGASSVFSMSLFGQNVPQKQPGVFGSFSEGGAQANRMTFGAAPLPLPMALAQCSAPGLAESNVRSYQIEEDVKKPGRPAPKQEDTARHQPQTIRHHSPPVQEKESSEQKMEATPVQERQLFSEDIMAVYEADSGQAQEALFQSAAPLARPRLRVGRLKAPKEKTKKQDTLDGSKSLKMPPPPPPVEPLPSPPIIGMNFFSDVSEDEEDYCWDGVEQLQSNKGQLLDVCDKQPPEIRTKTKVPENINKPTETNRIFGEPSPPFNIWKTTLLMERKLKRNSSLESLFSLRKGNHWCPSDELARLVGINFDECKQMFIEAGLKSLGSRAEVEVMEYLVTLFVVLTILHLRSNASAEVLSKHIAINPNLSDISLSFRERQLQISVRQTNEVILTADIDLDQQQCLRECGRWIVEMDRKYPTVDSMLGLSATKTTILLQMFEALMAFNHDGCLECQAP